MSNDFGGASQINRVQSVIITGIWLRKDSSGKIEVLAEIDGKFRKCIVDGGAGLISHIVEPSGILSSPVDETLYSV